MEKGILSWDFPQSSDELWMLWRGSCAGSSKKMYDFSVFHSYVKFPGGSDKPSIALAGSSELGARKAHAGREHGGSGAKLAVSCRKW